VYVCCRGTHILVKAVHEEEDRGHLGEEGFSNVHSYFSSLRKEWTRPFVAVGVRVIEKGVERLAGRFSYFCFTSSVYAISKG
jgi:hypothetical protein